MNHITCGRTSVIGAALINRSSLSRLGTQQFDLTTVPWLVITSATIVSLLGQFAIAAPHTTLSQTPLIRRHVAETRRTRQDDAEPANVEELGQVRREQELCRL